MARSSNASFLGLLILAGSASAATLGPVKGGPVAGRPLEVNIPFAVDAPTDRACASAKVRYGTALVPGATLDVQGQGLKRNLLVTSRASVNAPTVTVDARVGCGPKAVARRFVLPTNLSNARSPRLAEPSARHAAYNATMRPAPRPVALIAAPEPLFPPAAQAAAAQGDVHPADAPMPEELRKAQAEAATAIAQLDAARRELAAVLDVERRTSQTLIDADHEVRDAKSQVARMRVVLYLVGIALALAAAGVIWFEFQRLAARRRPSGVQRAQEPTIVATVEVASPRQATAAVLETAGPLPLQPQ